MYGLKIALTHKPISMIIHNLDVISIAVAPDETYSPLVVDANADWSARCPLSFSSLLPGGAFRDSSRVAADNISNLRAAARWISWGKRRDKLP